MNVQHETFDRKVLKREAFHSFPTKLKTRHSRLKFLFQHKTFSIITPRIMRIVRYLPKHSLLKRLIKYFWVLKTDSSISLNHKLLPVNNVDIILNFGSPMIYEFQGENKETPAFFFHGMSKRYRMVRQIGYVYQIGISFFPQSLYPLLKVPISEFQNQVINLNDVINDFGSQLENRVNPFGNTKQLILSLEDYLFELIDPQLIIDSSLWRLFPVLNSNFADAGGLKTIYAKYGINERRLERTFNKYVGISPKPFIRINRFNSALNRLIGESTSDLTSLAYESFYYDQSHFIKEFKAFTGSSPSKFIKERQSLKEIMSVFYNS